ncbi:NADH-quinone oxidoreductase cyanobacterial subunit N [Rubidibacter lacunae KORDI 51-2]|uniref:NAD(P)H-quinone oxidoreductase subunit N n=1 Tax=Rubidibacter lacunae KORDI 51-2 TaxID=582515 RepID=U5DNN1_9CHRO|nr:NAD(P)H-quinone oxidoreductase subunit N [Rubidibacter lacunae]ERN42214.1 NADH-quinone oxidoreductase cyanobacterial subunit N [Rubidibacter lacunae KORDI 51-2]
MPLLTSGKGFIRDLERANALAIYAPLEGGFEGRYQRRLRAQGYVSLSLSARGLGDLASYLTGTHGVRPPHLGKKNIAREAAVGDIYFVPPIAGYQIEALPSWAKGLVLWVIEGYVLSQQEREYIVRLTESEPLIKVVLEMGGSRYFRWQPLADTAAS